MGWHARARRAVNPPEEYRIVTLANGARSVHAVRHAETFHPVIGPAAEAEALYVEQLRLRERVAASRGPFVIWDVGLGAAANAVTVLRATRALATTIELVSFDCTLAPLRFALEHEEELGYFGEYGRHAHELAAHPKVPLRFQDGGREVRWELHVGDFPSFLRRPEAGALPKPNAILYDAFSPAANSEMWTLALFTDLYRQLDLARPCALPTYSRSTMLRVTLLLAGFWVGAGQATGKKEETTIAANTPELIETPLDTRWLWRARRSSSAEPLRTAAYRQHRLSAESWELLQRHPQFGHG